ncbi:hypothetical protein [Actinoplanes sp. TFC3]|uniref:hypothetical protein n=1 Tax=Actinoplanes sp. TFC3 TaxID=1710355 RepID=UPI00082A0733|nr:hypothetical protein [Actinoplanes sp. TFC3]
MYALIGAPAIWLFVAIIRLIPSGVGLTFLSRAQNSFYSYVNLEIILLPLAAVLLAHLIQPRHRQARLVTVVALIEYAVAAFFAVVFGFLIAIVKIAGSSIRVAFEELLVRVAWLAVFAVAAYAVFMVWQTLYSAPKPQPSPYGSSPYGSSPYGGPQQAPHGGPQQHSQPPWGQPQQGQQGGYPGQAPYGQPGGGQPGGFPGPQPGGAQQPGASAGSQGGASAEPWGQAPAWGGPTTQQPAVNYPQGAPFSSPPASPSPASAPPSFGAPASAPPSFGAPASSPPSFGAPSSAPPAYPGAGQSSDYPGAGQPSSEYSNGGQAPTPPPGPFAPSPGHPHGTPQPPAGGYADPTAAIPAHNPDDDRTEVFRQDPPRT